MTPSPGIPGPWPALVSPLAAAGEFDPAGPLAAMIGLPLVGALALAVTPTRFRPLAARMAGAWTLPGAAFALAAAWLGGTAGGPSVVRWLEAWPMGGGLVLSIWNLVPALLTALAAPLALWLPEPREKTPARAAFLLVLTSANLAAILATGPGGVTLAWMAGAWALYFLLGEADAETGGKAAVAPFFLHTLAAACVLLAALAPPLLPLLVVAGVIRLGAPPLHGMHARALALLPTGALLLVLVGFTATGLAAVRDGVAALAAHGGSGLGSLAVFAGFGALWAGLVALAETDLKRRIAGFASAQAALWIALLAACDPVLGRPAVGGWALVTTVTLALLVVAYAPLWAFARTGDLKAYGGLGRVALVRSTLLLVALAALLFAPFLSARGAGAAAMFFVLGARLPAGVPLAVGGALGLLAVGLAVYRTIRGEAAMPIPAPDLNGREWGTVALFGAALYVLSVLGPRAGGLGSLWPVFTAGVGS